MITGKLDLTRGLRAPQDGTREVAQQSAVSPAEGGEDLAVSRVRLLGVWSARACFLIELGYVVVFIAGFASIRTTNKPLPDPYLAMAEILILLLAPTMVCLMVAIHQSAPAEARPFTQMALGWMIAAAAFTIVVHFVQLTVARHINHATFPGYARIFDWQWPSAFYAIDIAAWDIFFALALLFAVPAFAGRLDATPARRGLILSGSLSLIGLIGPFANVLGLRTIGIIGYTVVFGLTCLPLSRTFTARTPRADPGAA